MKTVFITGVGKGLGRELFSQLLRKNYQVIGLLRNETDFKDLSSRLPGNAQLILGDVSTDEVTQKISDQVSGPVDLLINNAGVSGRGVRLASVKAAEMNEVFNVHCTGALRVTQALELNLLLSDAPVVINISSRMGSITNQDVGVYKDLKVSYSYRIAKAAQNMFTACLRNEMGSKIKIISLHPGRMKTQKAQVDADMEPSESAERIITTWESGHLKVINGILELPAKEMPW